jgi:flagellar hook protein FlgE
VPVIGEPDTGTLGQIAGNSLEDSNVDLTGELVNLIKAQSNYQANAKTISTESTIMQTIIQMT